MRKRLSIQVAVVVMALLFTAGVVRAAETHGSRRAARVSPAATIVAPNVIGFESDLTTFPSEPFTSLDNPTVHFHDTIGVYLQVADFGGQSDGRGLAVNPDDHSAVEIVLDVRTSRLSLTFGNDQDPVLPGDKATLRVYRGEHLVATKRVTVNGNGLGDQVITYQGDPISRATFIYEVGPDTPLNAHEVVDAITLAQVCALEGDKRANRLTGTDSANGICGLGGADRIKGRAGNDVLRGDKGDDRVDGQAGNDLIVGGSGGDILRSVDGVGGNDTVYGGAGHDECKVDVGDIVYSCEVVVT